MLAAERDALAAELATVRVLDRAVAEAWEREWARREQAQQQEEAQ